MTEYRLGVQLFSVRNELGPKVGRTLDRLAGMGYTHVEPFDILSDTGGLKTALDATGLRAETAHCKITELDADRVIAAAQQLGISTVIVPWVDPKRLTDRDGIAAFASEINESAQYAASHGIRVGYHNHDFEFAQSIDGHSAYETLLGHLDDDILLEVDTYWASVGGADVFELLHRLGSRVRYLHVKNEPVGTRPIRGVDLNGRMAEVLDAARGSLEFPVVEVVVDEGEEFDVLARNATYFSGLVNR